MKPSLKEQKEFIEKNIVLTSMHEDIVAFVELIESQDEGKVEKYKTIMRMAWKQNGKSSLYVLSRGIIKAGGGKEEVHLAVKELAQERREEIPDVQRWRQNVSE